jgi:hypothetical protein
MVVYTLCQCLESDGRIFCPPLYGFSYKQFLDWQHKRGIKSSFSENVLIAYIGELSETVNY